MNSTSKQKFLKRQQQGFTLIELVIVIVILAILSAFALPRFLDLTSDARIATIEGVAGSMRSASSIVRVACSVDPSCEGEGDETLDSDTSNLDGSDIELQDGYPDQTSSGILRAAQIENIRSDDDSDSKLVVESTGADDPMTVFLDIDGDGTAGDCQVTYSDPNDTDNSLGEPLIEVVTSGC